jgi:NitT/TauT family transport system permease protein
MSNVPSELRDDIPTFDEQPSPSSRHGPIDWTGLTSMRTAKSALEVGTIVGLALAIFFGLEAILRWTDTPTYVFPKPIDVVRVLWNEFMPVFAHHLWVTMYEFLAGFAIGAAIGLVLAALITQ